MTTEFEYNAFAEIKFQTYRASRMTTSSFKAMPIAGVVKRALIAITIMTKTAMTISTVAISMVNTMLVALPLNLSFITRDRI